MSSRPAFLRRMLIPAALLSLAVPLGLSQGGASPKSEPVAVAADVAADKPGRPGGYESAREAALALFDARGAGESPEKLAKRFDQNVDFYIQGDTSAVPWIGRKVGRSGAAEHFRQLMQAVEIRDFKIDTTLGEGKRAMIVGTFQGTVLATGRSMGGEYAFDITIGRDGLITRYHLFEDTWAVSEAVNPSDR
ncbi:nuclear transport factor 2 family protein [Streptomyces parvulus]|uniref:Nuclear transport factor 2 family protein n=2 Tax=Streptomyces parvulus TaxID=146923 RepID=A0A369UX29_9ACTN|nr:nuclear transport factor 2 family protein [Streptomyces parvulus]